MRVTEYYMDDAPEVVIVQNPMTNDWFIDGEGEDHKSEGERLLYDTFKYDALKRIGLIKALNGKVATA